MNTLTVDYRPSSVDEVIGQDKAARKLKTFVDDFDKKDKNALLLYGPPGSGKTSLVHALAEESDAEILEVNASDFRNKEGLKESIGNASSQQSLFSSTKIILVDEAEGLFGNADRGGVSALKDIIKSSSFPVILTANDPWDKKFRPVRNLCQMVEMDELDHQDVLKVLRKVCEKEGISFEEKALTSLARRAGGDLRGALIDLQSLATGGSFEMSDLDQLDERDKKSDIFEALSKVFKSTDAFVARTAFNDLEEDLEEIQLWIDKNLPKEYKKPSDLYRAYQKLSLADVFRGRIRRSQHWRFLAIINNLLSVGVALSKDKKYKGFTRYEKSDIVTKRWKANRKYKKRNSLAKKVGIHTHTSIDYAVHKTLPYLRIMFNNDDVLKESVSESFELNDKEVEWLTE